MTASLLDRCLTARPEKMGPQDIATWCRSWADRISRDGETVLALARRVAGDAEPADEEAELLFAVLDSARMNWENRESGAEQVLADLERGLATVRTELDTVARMRLCAAYARAGLEPPAFLRIGEDDVPFDAMAEMESGGMPDITTLVADMLPDEAGGLDSHMILSEALASMEDGPAGFFVRMMVSSGDARLVALGRYFLLDPRTVLRVAAGQGFGDLAQSGRIDGALLSALIAVRNWIPADAAREALDAAIKGALAREASGGTLPRAWTVHRAVSSLPDGTGSQSILATVSRGSEKGIAALLLKAGHGVKDAYVVPASSASEQRHLMEQIAQELPCHEIAPSSVPDWLALALGEGLAAGRPPAPGLIDTAPMLGATDVTPAEPSTAAWLALADPEGSVAAMAKTRRGRLIGLSRDWPRDYEIADSWFLSDAELSERLAEAMSERAARSAVWQRLESQRQDWARLFARAAAVLRATKDAADDAWQEFAATALALEEGRALKKIPVFEFIVDQTLDAADGAAMEGLAPFDDEDDPGFDDLDVAPEKQGELARLLKGTALSGDLIDGYLTGILAAPEFTSPTEWLPSLVGDLELKGDGSIQRFLDIVMLRYGDIDTRVREGQAGSVARSLSGQKYADWLAGLAMATRLKSAWPKRALTKDDRKMLRLVSEAETDTAAGETVKPLLPAWLEDLGRRLDQS